MDTAGGGRRAANAWFLGLSGLLGALPTLVWAAHGPGLFLDDWGLAALARSDPVKAFALELRSRPVLSLFHGCVFFLADAHPVLHAVIQATLNAAAAILIAMLAWRWLAPRFAILTTAAWVVLGNRNTTRFWPTQEVNVFALVLVLAAAAVGLSPPTTRLRRALAVGLAVTAALTYEACGVLAVAVAAVTVVRGPGPHRRIAAGGVVAAFGAVGLWMLTHSAKQGGARWFRYGDRLLATHLGAGVLPPPAVPLGALVLVVFAWAIWATFTGRQSAGVEARMMVVGAVLVVLGWLPGAVAGFPSGTSGVLDRLNIFPDVGVSVMWAGAIALLWRVRLPGVAVVLSAALIGLLTFNLVAGLTHYEQAAADSRRFLRALDVAAAADSHMPLVVAPLPDRAGLAAFVEIDEHDLRPALYLRARKTRLSYPSVTLTPSLRVACRSPHPLQLVGSRLVPAHCR